MLTPRSPRQCTLAQCLPDHSSWLYLPMFPGRATIISYIHIFTVCYLCLMFPGRATIISYIYCLLYVPNVSRPGYNNIIYLLNTVCYMCPMFPARATIISYIHIFTVCYLCLTFPGQATIISYIYCYNYVSDLSGPGFNVKYLQFVICA